MKRIFLSILLLSTVGLMSCSDTKGKSNDKQAASAENVQANSELKGPVFLNKTAFLSKVHNFEANQNWKFEGDKPVIVDFYADWCKPCKMVAPFLEELAVKYDGQVEIYKVNVDMEQDIAAFYQISSIPTFFFIDSKGQVTTDLGYKPMEYFEQRILGMIGTTQETE